MQRIVAVMLGVGALGLVACGGGTKMLKEPQAVQLVKPLATVSDAHISVALDWVIIRAGPGTWAKNADWDEYLLRIENVSTGPVDVTGIALFDSLGTRLDPGEGRKVLVKASKRTKKRYKDSGLEVKAGRSGVGMFATGAAITFVGYTAAAVAAQGAIMAGSASAGGAGVVAGGILLAGPALAIGGIIRNANNSKVDKEIRRRQSALPLQVLTDSEQRVDVFFPLAPSPTHMEIRYRSQSGEQVLALDLKEAMDGLHLQSLQ